MNMITATNYTVGPDLLDKVMEICYSIEEFKTTVNMPTGNFFYDPWTIKEEFKGTVVDSMLSVLPFDIGEARIIKLDTGHTYHKHADIDDRFHLNLSGDDSFLIDLDQLRMYPVTTDGIWYEMNTEIRHSAASFGENNRYQLIVRKLLRWNQLKNPVKVTVTPQGKNPRFVFDNTLSPWLNRANKFGIISDFEVIVSGCRFSVEHHLLSELTAIIPNNFKFEVNT